MKSLVLSALDRIESAGNRLPHPAVLFIWLCGLILLLSAVGSWSGLTATHPINGDQIEARSLISAAGLGWILTNTVSNFVQFAPVGTVLVAILGIGIAERSGLLQALLRILVLRAKGTLLTFMVVMAGVLSSLAADAGYVVLIPLAALAFKTAGRPALAGIAAAFAGVSGGFSANLLIGPLDALLAGISTEATQLVDPNYVVTAAHNYYFIVVSTLLISVLGSWVTEKLVIPRLPAGEASDERLEHLNELEQKGLKYVGLFSVVIIGLLLAALLPEQGILRNPQTGGVLDSPFIRGIVTLIAVYAALAGLIFGRITGTIQRTEDMIEGMEKTMGTMASYLVLMFFAAQFVNYFSWSQLGGILAIHGAELLKALELSSAFLVIGFVFLAALINLLVGSASAKWALLAPIFVPMFYLLGIAPEASQVAFRIGDSVTNIITPLMPYFGVVVAFARQHDENTGIGTLIATMLPYSITFLLGWSVLLLIWVGMDWPLGPGARIALTP